MWTVVVMDPATRPFTLLGYFVLGLWKSLELCVGKVNEYSELNKLLWEVEDKNAERNADNRDLVCEDIGEQGRRKEVRQKSLLSYVFKVFGCAGHYRAGDP